MVNALTYAVTILLSDPRFNDILILKQKGTKNIKLILNDKASDWFNLMPPDGVDLYSHIEVSLLNCIRHLNEQVGYDET